MKSVRKVLKKKIPRYNLRSKRSYLQTRPIVSKVDTTVQCDLSEEDNFDRLKELPFSTLSYSDFFRPTSESYYSTSPLASSSHRSTAFSTPGRANVTQCEPVDISIEQAGRVIAEEDPRGQPIEVGSEYFQPSSSSSPSWPPCSSSVRPAPQEEERGDLDDRGSKEIRNRRFPVINSPGDLIKLVPQREHREEDSLSEGTYESSSTDDDAASQVSDFNEDNKSERSPKENSNISHMAMDLLQGLQEQMAAVQAQLTVHQTQQKKTADTLEHSPIPEIASTHRPVPFHGYDSEDVNRWLDKLEYYLKLRRIDVRSPTALAELVLNLSGPAEDFFYSLPDDCKETFGQLRNAMKERFSNDNQSWITWQAVTTRQQGEIEPLDVYLTDLTKNFRRLNITDAEKMRYFVQGLRNEIRKAVLMKQPKSFREAEQMARLACSVENTMNSSREDSIAAQLGNLSQTVKSLMMTGTNPNAKSLKEDTKLMEMMEQNNAVLADLSASINKLEKPTVEPKVRFAPQNAVNQTSVAALSSPHNTERSEINELKEFLLEKIQSLDRQFDARIRGILRRNQGQREEIPRERTRDGRPTCFTSVWTNWPFTSKLSGAKKYCYTLPNTSITTARSKLFRKSRL